MSYLPKITRFYAIALTVATAITTFGGIYTLIAIDLNNRDSVVTVIAKMTNAGFDTSFDNQSPVPVSNLDASFAFYDASGSLLAEDFFVPKSMLIAANGGKHATIPLTPEMAGLSIYRFCAVYDGGYGFDRLKVVYVLAGDQTLEKFWGEISVTKSTWILREPACDHPKTLDAETLSVIEKSRR